MTRIGFIGTTIGLSLGGFLLYHYAGRVPEPVAVSLTPGPPQPRVTPEEAGIDRVAIEQAATYAGERNTRALLVGHGGHVVYERYWDDVTADTPVDPGFAPVLLALAVGSAMNDRLVNNLDAPVSNYLAGTQVADGAITLRQLLAQDTTLPADESTDLLALVVERVTGQPYPQLLAERFWKPMGAGSLEFRGANSQLRPQGVNAGCCLRARIGDWMRIGELLAHDGVFEANQFTPPRYVKLMLSPAHKDSARGFFTRVDGDFASRDTAWLEGTDRQRLWIVPSLRLYILRIGGAPDSSRGWDEAMIPDSIIRGVRDWQVRPVPEGIDPKKYAPH